METPTHSALSESFYQLTPERILEAVENERSLVILPPFYYGAASYAVEPPEGNGSLHVDAEKLFAFAQARRVACAAAICPKPKPPSRTAKPGPSLTRRGALLQAMLDLLDVSFNAQHTVRSVAYFEKQREGLLRYRRGA